MKRAVIAAAALLAGCASGTSREDWARLCVERGQEVTACVDGAERLFPQEAPQVRR